MKKEIKNYIFNGMRFIITFLSLFFLIPQATLAVGVEVKPSNLEILLPDQKVTELSVANISQEPILVTAQADHFRDNINIYPSEFKLLPEEIIKLNLISDFTGHQEGVKNTYVSIVSKPLDRQSFNAASGIKIPTTITISQTRWEWSGSAVFVISFLFLLLFAVIVQGIISLFEIRYKKPKWHVNLALHHKKPWYRRIFRK